MLKKGPEIKLPELKVPDFALDVYHDLRERHLLPLVALLVLAVIAVPIALSTGTTSTPSELGLVEEEAEPPTPGEAEKEGKIIVAKSAPGLRDYRRRLKHQDPKDPFINPNPPQDEEEGTSTDANEGSTIPAESGGSPTLPDELPEGNNAPNAPGGEFKFYSYAIDVKVVPVSSNGHKKKGKATIRHNLPNLTKLPSRNTPAIMYMGVTQDAKRAVMLISPNVTGAFGDGLCISGGSETCQLMALEKGIPETFAYGGKKQIFKIEVLKIRLLSTDKLNVAPLGNAG